MSDESSAAVGIDLGTTYSAVAHLDAHGRPVTLVNAEGDLVTPSVVLAPGVRRPMASGAVHLVATARHRGEPAMNGSGATSEAEV